MSLTTGQIQIIADTLYDAWLRQEPIQRMTQTYGDFSKEDAYEIQKIFVQKQIASGQSPAGKKIGLTSKAMRELVHIDEPDYGSIFYERCFGNGSELDTGSFIIPRVEAELLFKLKQDLPGPVVTPQDVVAATEYVAAAFEIIDNRYNIEEQEIVDSIADNAAFGACVIGDIPGKVDELDLRALGLVMEKNNKQICTGSGAAVMGDPLNAIVWLAEKMAQLGDPLRAGDLVLSGSIIAAVDVARGDCLRGYFGPLGEVSVSFR